MCSFRAFHVFAVQRLSVAGWCQFSRPEGRNGTVVVCVRYSDLLGAAVSDKRASVIFDFNIVNFLAALVRHRKSCTSEKHIECK